MNRARILRRRACCSGEIAKVYVLCNGRCRRARQSCAQLHQGADRVPLVVRLRQETSMFVWHLI